MIQQLNIDLVLEFRVHKYFFKDPKRLTLEKVKSDLNSLCNLSLYDFLEDDEYIKFKMKKDLLENNFNLFMIRQTAYMLNNDRFNEVLSIIDSLEKQEINKTINKLQKDNYKYIHYNPCNYIKRMMLKRSFNYEVEFSSITLCDSNGDFILEDNDKFFLYLKSLMKRRYPELGDAIYIYFILLEKENI